MGKKRRILFAILAFAALCVLAWIVLSPRAEPEPVYQGKPLSVWLKFYDPLNTNRTSPQLGVAQTGIRQMGTNAIPTMLRMLRTPDLRWKNWLFALMRKQHFIKINYVEPSRIYEQAAMGLEVLGHRATGAVPELMKIFDQNPSPQCQAAIARVVGVMGPDAKAAIPSLLHGVASTNQVVHANSLYALGKIHAEPDLAVPVLINSLQDRDPIVRWNAASSLGDFGPDAKAAVPALVKFIESEDPAITTNSTGVPFPLALHVKETALHSLKRIDPEAAAKLSTNLDQNVK